MKLNGIFGKGSGKVGESVWAVSGGVQIVRPYNPNVTNPQTPAQVQQRAKFKLMSQVAADLASIIAFKKKGLVSARNQFVSANIGLCTFQDGKAELDLTGLDLTGSSATLPAFQATAGQDGKISASLTGAAAADVDAVLYALVHETDDDKLEVSDIKVATDAGDGRTFAAQLQVVNGDKCVYAYGIKYTDAASRQRYADYVAEVGNELAYLDAIKSELLSGASFTRTRYASL